MPRYLDYDHGDEMPRWQWVVTILTVLILIILGSFIFSLPTPPEPEPPCETYRNNTLRWLPSRCLSYYQNNPLNK